MKEIWKDIKGYEGLYQVSNLGNVMSLSYNHAGWSKLLKPLKGHHAYYVSLHKKCKAKNFFIHRLVADAFLENPNNYDQINHKDENTANNTVTNLEWCDAKYNSNYGTHKLKLSKIFRNRKDQSKPVLQYDTNMNLIKEHPSIRDICREYGYNRPGISRCCHRRKNYNTAYGYIWRFKNEKRD